MAFTEDLAPYFNDEDFAEVATWTPTGGSPTSVNVIFDDEYVEIDSGQVGISGSRPMALCPVSAVPAIAEDEPFDIGGVNYKVAESKPDGTGLMIIILKKA